VTALPQDPAAVLPGWMDLPDGLSAAEYSSAGVHTRMMTVTEPVAITIDLSTLL
jgi:hypothetical protein